MCKIILRMRSRPVARLLYGEVWSNKETDQRVWRGKSLGRGELCLSENELCSKFAIGGAHFECISVSQLGGSRPSEMAGNAFKTNMVWWNYIRSTKNIAIKKRFSKKTCVALNRSFNILQATQRAGSSICQSWREFSYLPTVKITIQIQCFAENYGKQTPKGILLRNETMSCRHTKSSFYTLRRLRHILWKESSLETQEQSVGSGEKAGQKFSSTGERALGPYQTISKTSGGCQLLIGPKKCFVLLCPIGEHISRVLFMCSYTRAIVSIMACVAHAPKKCTQSGNFQFDFKFPSDFKLLSVWKLKMFFQKIQASAYNRYSRLHQPRLAYIFMRKFLKDTTTADSHENVAWKSELIFFSASIVFIPTNLLCQMQPNSSGAEFLSTIS